MSAGGLVFIVVTVAIAAGDAALFVFAFAVCVGVCVRYLTQWFITVYLPKLAAIRSAKVDVKALEKKAALVAAYGATGLPLSRDQAKELAEKVKTISDDALASKAKIASNLNSNLERWGSDRVAVVAGIGATACFPLGLIVVGVLLHLRCTSD